MTKKKVVAFAGESSLAINLRQNLESNSNLEVYSLAEVIASGKGEAVELVLEVNNLDLEQKKKNLQMIEKHIGAKTLILSTVLGLTATETASWLLVPERLVGFASFAPIESRGLVELTAALQTKGDYLEKATRFFAELNKEVEVVADEVGLVFPRILAMIMNEAAFALMQGTASAEDIDSAMLLGTNYPHGPLAWADIIGLDDIFAVLSGLQRELGEERYRPAPLLRKMLYAGYLGEQSGQGFYKY